MIVNTLNILDEEKNNNLIHLNTFSYHHQYHPSYYQLADIINHLHALRHYHPLQLAQITYQTANTAIEIIQIFFKENPQMVEPSALEWIIRKIEKIKNNLKLKKEIKEIKKNHYQLVFTLCRWPSMLQMPETSDTV